MEQGGVSRDFLIANFCVERLVDSVLKRHKLMINYGFDVNLQSVQYFVEFLRGDEHEATELVLYHFSLADPSDGGLDVLCDFFANQTTLNKIKLTYCTFGNAEEASQLIAALQTNRVVIELTFYGIENLEGAAFGNCISGLLLNNTTLQRLELGPSLGAQTIRALQPGLRSNRHLKILVLSYCGLQDESLRLIVDALVGNTAIEVFDIRGNLITGDCLPDITRLVKFTQLKKIRAEDSRDNNLFANHDGMKNFISVLRQHTSLECFSGYDFARFPRQGVIISNLLDRNTSIRHANELLALQPRAGLPIGAKSGIWYMAMAQMGQHGNNNNNSGASAIFHILQKRPALLEKQLRRPAAAAALHSTATTEDAATGGQKRQRLLK